MLQVSDEASKELKKFFETDRAKNQNLVIYFQGMGWGGPSLGMALDESIGELNKLESNGITAYIDPNLENMLKQFGSINVDYINNGPGATGFTIKAGSGSADCGSCGSNTGSCG